jgi:hypothetical protein
MLSLDDNRWPKLLGGYRVPFDVRPLLSKLEKAKDTEPVWEELWSELHHQGDIGEASFAAVPHLVRIYRKRGIIDWNTFAIAAVIELARKEGSNPDVPDWLKKEYFLAIKDLAEIAVTEILITNDPYAIRSMLSLVAIQKGLRIHGKFLANYSEDEMLEIESRL